jgi:ABC-2 type transport system permease protein
VNARRIWVQCIKELVEFRRDRLTVALAFALPVAMLLIFGLAIRLQIKNIPVAVQDFDRSPFSREFVSRIAASQELAVIAEPLGPSPTDILDAGTASAVIVIPPGTQRALAAGRPAPIQSLVDGTDVVNALTIKQILAAACAFVGAAYAPPAAPVVVLHERIWFNPGDNEALFIVPGIYGVILAMYPTLLAAIAMVRDKERGTIVQAYASRLRASELIAGKCLALTAIGLAEALTIMAIGLAVWNVHFAGDPTPLLIATPLVVCCQVLLGLFIGGRTNTVTSAIQAAGSINSLLSVLLSGFLYPVFTMPLVFQWLSYIVPARHYINIARDAFVRGSGWSGVWSEVFALAIIAALLAVAAWLPMRRMQIEGGR